MSDSLFDDSVAYERNQYERVNEDILLQHGEVTIDLYMIEYTHIPEPASSQGERERDERESDTRPTYGPCRFVVILSDQAFEAALIDPNEGGRSNEYACRRKTDAGISLPAAQQEIIAA